MKINLSIIQRRVQPCHDEVKGFTLIELLVVMAIMALLITLGGPSFLGIFKGSALSEAGQMVQDQLTYYRQYALANNQVVEVRFYNYKDPSLVGDTGHYRAMQAFALVTSLNNGVVSYTKTSIGKAVRLPTAMIIDAGPSSKSFATSNLSPLITSCVYGAGTLLPGYTATPVSTDPLLPVIGNVYSYAYFEFKPDGSTNFPVSASYGPWIFFVTLHPVSTGDPSTVAKNSNYYTVQLDPFNGHIYSYRP